MLWVVGTASTRRSEVSLCPFGKDETVSWLSRQCHESGTLRIFLQYHWQAQSQYHVASHWVQILRFRTRLQEVHLGTGIHEGSTPWSRFLVSLGHLFRTSKQVSTPFRCPGQSGISKCHNVGYSYVLTWRSTWTAYFAITTLPRVPIAGLMPPTPAIRK